MSLFKTAKITMLGVILSTVWACSPQATEKKVDFVVEQDYNIIRDTPSATPEISEHFSLYCGHCYHSETKFKKLKETLADNVKFNRSHVFFLPQKRPDWGKNMTFAVASAGVLNVEDKFIDTIFDTHFEQKKYIGEYAQLQSIFETLGVDATTFKATMNDETTLENVRTMVNRASDDKVRFTPDLIVNNKYRVVLSKLDEVAKEKGITEQEQLNQLVAYLLTNPE